MNEGELYNIQLYICVICRATDYSNPVKNNTPTVQL